MILKVVVKLCHHQVTTYVSKSGHCRHLVDRLHLCKYQKLGA